MEDLTTRITFLGTSSAVPEVGSDTASMLINDRILVDTGWKVTENLRKLSIEPTSIEHLVFTHFHQDHYLSLPSLLFYILMKKKDLRGLKIVGPKRDLELTINRTLEFLNQGRYIVKAGKPELIPLEAGESYETSEFRLETCGTIHPVPGLCYRFTDNNSGAVISFTGDTAYHPPIAEFVRGSKLLVHEAALGPGAGDPSNNESLHSGAQDAARIAVAAGVEQLLLIHGPHARVNGCVEAARKIFNGDILWPKEGQTVQIHK
ncbi:MBL fold metallo-hydrolase [Paenibacillus filicis]|uniref:MBL fold metallo-hydrolase n=1 Tax=Paenibacillus gyeongsangnamensis TaxID=3388067 RepID=A0ABT4Q458_9BACL|nr:MBL fold metallo-hydrolase [Paenibacillus filicis]MCZ8511665.1 MBL fold metallo-hydrolase [Paenibacillus filicis]